MRSVRFLYQRLTRGWDDSQLWNLDVTISEYVLPRLKEYRKLYSDSGIPSGIKTTKEWQEKIDAMISAFEIVLKNEGRFNEKERIIVENGLTAFAEHFTSLWD